MRSAATSIDLDASVACVWQVLTDVDTYSDWHPGLSVTRGSLRANSRLEVSLRIGPGSEPRRTTSAVVLDVHRHRWMRWLLPPPVGATDPERHEPEAGLYEVKLMARGPNRVTVTQRLSLPARFAGWAVEPASLEGLLDDVNAALKERVAWASVHQPLAPQIQGTIRVSSHVGSLPSRTVRRSSMVNGVTGLLPERTQPAVA